MKNPQALRMLKALKEAGANGLHPTYFIVDLHIYQYNARIYNLRAAFGCTCKNGGYCSAKEHIKNRDQKNGSTKFFYIDDNVYLNEAMKKYQDEVMKQMRDDDQREQEELF